MIVVVYIHEIPLYGVSSENSLAQFIALQDSVLLTDTKLVCIILLLPSITWILLSVYSGAVGSFYATLAVQ